jgi:hypothetical protein
MYGTLSSVKGWATLRVWEWCIMLAAVLLVKPGRCWRQRQQWGGAMTEFVIKLGDDSQAGLLLAQLKRLVTAEGIDLSVEQNGKEIALEHVFDDDAQLEAVVNQIIADKLAGKLEPLTEEERRENEAYWENVGKELNLTDDDIVRLVKDVRAESRAKTAT